jgi:UDP-glucose 4-epimerase
MTTRERTSDFEDPRNFLVTGGAGFIGSHLCDLLLRRGHYVVALDDLSTGSLSNVDGMRGHRDFRLVEGSVLDDSLVSRLVGEADVVVHLAAAVGVRLIVEQPVRTLEANVLGTFRLLQAARKHGRKTLLASTSEVYGKGTKVPFSEDDHVVLGPTSRSRWAYATSKMLDEFLALAHNREFGVPIVIFRLFNIVGPRQTGKYGMVLPRFVAQALGSEALTVHGDGRQTRSFCDVRDAVEAIAGLAGSEQAVGKVVNIGGSEEITILELAQRVIDRLHSSSQAVLVPYSQVYGPGFDDLRRRQPDLRRIRSILGWQPRITLEETIDSLADSLRRSQPAAT